MRYIFADFEMNPVDRKFKEVRKICRSEIIEMGASMLDENMNEISCFRVYVKPQYNDKIVPYCSRLTGISMDRLLCADHFPEALNKFVQWCKSCGEDFRIYAWSGSDLVQLREQMNLYGIEPAEEISYIIENWMDFQEEYCRISGESESPSLDRALDMAGCSFCGERHDALWDARNTAELFIMTRDEEEFRKKRQKIMEIMTPQPLSFRLGSFFPEEKRDMLFKLR